MNRREHLIAETFIGKDGEHFACIAARHARRRRFVKRAGLISGVVCAITTTFVLTRPPPIQTPLAPVATNLSPVVEIISDQELLAQLKGQPVLVLKDESGITGIVFLSDTADRKL